MYDKSLVIDIFNQVKLQMQYWRYVRTVSISS